MEEIKQKTRELYQAIFTEKINKLDTESKNNDNEQKAQKYAIKETALRLFKAHSSIDKGIIWSHIYRAHVARKSGVDISPETIQKVKSADQSWIKSSGHAFEEMVKDLSNETLKSEGINIYLQKDISALLKKNEIKNEERDVVFLKSNLKSDTFDLFAGKDGYIFGAIQAKTSIRDRVTRDREPSIAAMNHFFWSIVFVLDGDFLRLPKFQAMVRGGSDSYPENGWHGLYAFSLPTSITCSRIYKLDQNLETLKKHATQAYNEWKNRRQWFGHNWEAKNE